jgi:hypothetical protein
MHSNIHVKAAGIVVLLIAGCSVHVKDADRAGNEDSKANKEVAIKSPFGNLQVHTDKVDAKDTGMSVYPGARLKQNEEGKNDNKANVNIDTPWFGVKVVALTYETDDPQEKVWEYYKKELSKYGRVLECKPGSPDMDLRSTEKNQLTCHDNNKNSSNRHMSVDPNDMQLKVGRQDAQRVVGFKPTAKGTQFSIVYVATHGDEKDKI